MRNELIKKVSIPLYFEKNGENEFVCDIKIPIIFYLTKRHKNYNFYKYSKSDIKTIFIEQFNITIKTYYGQKFCEIKIDSVPVDIVENGKNVKLLTVDKIVILEEFVEHMPKFRKEKLKGLIDL